MDLSCNIISSSMNLSGDQPRLSQAYTSAIWPQIGKYICTWRAKKSDIYLQRVWHTCRKTKVFAILEILINSDTNETILVIYQKIFHYYMLVSILLE